MQRNFLDILFGREDNLGAKKAPGGGGPPYRVPSLLIALRRLRVLWITFVPKIMFTKVSFRLDSV